MLINIHIQYICMAAWKSNKNKQSNLKSYTTVFFCFVCLFLFFYKIRQTLGLFIQFHLDKWCVNRNINKNINVRSVHIKDYKGVYFMRIGKKTYYGS